MNLPTIIGLILGFGALIVGFILEGGTLGALVLLSPALIVFGGTFGATAISFQTSQLKKVPKLFLEAFRPSSMAEIRRTVTCLTEMAQTAKTNGLLKLESYLESNKSVMGPILERGVILLMDGTDSEELEAEMEAQFAVTEKSKHMDISVFEAMAGYSPTMGVIGTVMGLVQTLSHMGAPEELSHSIATAFIATLYGVCFANLLYLPIANKLKVNLKIQSICYELQLKGLIGIQQGKNTRAIKEMMVPYLQAAGMPAKEIGGDD